jgi:hypothetical protein
MSQNSIALETRLWILDELQYDKAMTHEIFQHHIRLGNLQQSSSTGCHLCTLLARLLNEDERALPMYESTPYLVRITSHTRYIYLHAISTQTRTSTTESLRLLHNIHDIPARIPSASLKYTYTGHPEVLKLAKTWLETCLISHKSCKESRRSEPRFVPTRLVKVTQTRNQVVSAHLVTREEIKPDTSYLALSYCWDGQMSCMLSMDNISQFRQALPQVLPKTLSDALSITLFLGYNHI